MRADAATVVDRLICQSYWNGALSGGTVERVGEVLHFPV